jgi:hypothetical protein
MAVGPGGELYVADTWSHRIRVVRDGFVTTLDGIYHSPRGLAVGPDGAVYVSDPVNHTISMTSAGGVVMTLAGSEEEPGDIDGVGGDAHFDTPTGIAMGPYGIYVADRQNQAIRVISLDGEVTTLAGGTGRGAADGRGAAARFSNPTSVAVGPEGTVYVADTHNNTIRMISGDEVTTLAGSAGQAGAADGPAADARFNYPSTIAISPRGIYVADTGNRVIRVIRGLGGRGGKRTRRHKRKAKRTRRHR